MDNEQLMRVIQALNISGTGLSAAHRALEQIVFALVATHPDKAGFLKVATHLLGSDAALQAAEQDKNLISAYHFHRARLLEEIQPLCPQ